MLCPVDWNCTIKHQGLFRLLFIHIFIEKFNYNRYFRASLGYRQNIGTVISHYLYKKVLQKISQKCIYGLSKNFNNNKTIAVKTFLF